jgi:sirohydrochlorin cobaltochelatase
MHRNEQPSADWEEQNIVSHSLDQVEMGNLEARIKTILPEQYQDRYEDVQPISMGSAGLKYSKNGTVAWNNIWNSFCDLAMAGGPPHKGVFLEPGTSAENELHSDRYQEVVDEICRGIQSVTGLTAKPSSLSGWISVKCKDEVMAGWLLRAIVMENISAHCEGVALSLPAGPQYRIEKEIKNVITAVAKTCHYWVDHMWLKQEQDIAMLFAEMAEKTPLIQPAISTVDGYDDHCQKVANNIFEITGLKRSKQQYMGWLGVDCPNVRFAITMMRALVASNVLARREGTILFLAVNPLTDAKGERVACRLGQIHQYFTAQGLL